MAGLVPAISFGRALCVPKRDARDKPAHDSEIGAAQVEIFQAIFLRIAFIRCGVTGNCFTEPGLPIASSIAAAIAAPTALTPASPAPYRPRELSGLGASAALITSIGGVSRTVGIR
jgi:hypothetical protein